MPTKISWTDEVWNPIVGCDPVSEGCDHCYAKAMTRRFPARFPDGFKVVMHPDRLLQPGGWRKPRRIFVNSMSDLFHPRVPDDFLRAVWNTMTMTPQHTYQVLTKRPVHMVRRMRRLGLRAPPHIWLGVSVENQRWADVRLPWLMQAPAKNVFVSIEPMLGPVNLSEWLGWSYGAPRRVKWVICGGESGPGHRPMDVEWARSLRDQCKGGPPYARVPFFFKQDSGPRPGMRTELDGREWKEFPDA